MQERQASRNIPEFGKNIIPPGEALYLSTTKGDFTELAKIYVRNGQVVMMNETTRQAIVLNVGGRYVLSRRALIQYKLDGKNERVEDSRNYLPEGFFDSSEARQVSRVEHFHIVVNGIDRDGNLNIAVKDVSRYGREEHSTYDYNGITEAPLSTDPIKISPIRIPTDDTTLTTPKVPVGPKPAKFRITDSTKFVIETSGGRQICRVSLDSAEKKVVLSNDDSDMEVELPVVGQTYNIDHQGMGREFFGSNDAVISPKHCTIKVLSVSADGKTAAFELSDTGSEFGTKASCEIAEFGEKEKERTPVAINSNLQITLQPGQVMTLETLRGSHIFYMYLFEGMIILQNIKTGKPFTLQPGEAFGVGKKNPKCNKEAMGDVFDELSPEHCGIHYKSGDKETANVSLTNFKPATGLQYATAAVPPQKNLKYDAIQNLNFDTPTDIIMLPSDKLQVVLTLDYDDGVSENVTIADLEISAGKLVLNLTDGYGKIELSEGKTMFGRRHQSAQILGPHAPSISGNHLAFDVKKLSAGRYSISLGMLGRFPTHVKLSGRNQ